MCYSFSIVSSILINKYLCYDLDMYIFYKIWSNNLYIYLKEKIINLLKFDDSYKKDLGIRK